MTNINLEEITKHWESTGLLQIFAENKIRNAAACLQAQLNLNEGKKHNDPQFLRCSVPIVARALSQSKAFLENEFLIGNDALEVHMFKTKFNGPKTGLDDLQKEADYTASFSETIKEEMDDFFKDHRGLVYFGGIERLTDGSVIVYYS